MHTYDTYIYTCICSRGYQDRIPLSFTHFQKALAALPSQGVSNRGLFCYSGLFCGNTRVVCGNAAAIPLRATATCLKYACRSCLLALLLVLLLALSLSLSCSLSLAHALSCSGPHALCRLAALTNPTAARYPEYTMPTLEPMTAKVVATS